MAEKRATFASCEAEFGRLMSDIKARRFAQIYLLQGEEFYFIDALCDALSNGIMEESMRSAKESIDLMTANQIQIRDIAAESRALIADSYLELQQIRENTGAVIKPIKDINDKIDTIIKGL